jgi:hypothetical protein
MNESKLLTLARAYIEAVEHEPELDILDTEDGLPAEGATKSASDWSWRAHDNAKQKAFDALRAEVNRLSTVVTRQPLTISE